MPVPACLGRTAAAVTVTRQPPVERRRSPRAAFSPACHPLLSPSPLIAFPNRAPAHAPVCARSPKCPVLHAPLPGAALVSDPSSLLRTSRVVSPRPFSPRVLLCRVARTLPALPSKPCPPPAQHSFCRSSTHPVTPLTPTGYGPQPLPLRLSPAPFPRSPRNPWPQHRAPPFLRASPTRNRRANPASKRPRDNPASPHREKKTRALPAPQHHPLPHAHAPPSFALHALQRTSSRPNRAVRACKPARTPSHSGSPAYPRPASIQRRSIQQHPAASLPACFSLPARYISAHAYSL